MSQGDTQSSGVNSLEEEILKRYAQEPEESPADKIEDEGEPEGGTQESQENEILGFNAKTGRKAGGVRTPSEMRTAPLVLGERVFVGLRNPWSLAGLSFASLARAKEPPDGDAEADERRPDKTDERSPSTHRNGERGARAPAS